MSYQISSSALTAAIRHLCRYGDTDIFPHLPELAFFADEQKAIIGELTTFDVDSYIPAGAFEALAPKSRYAFRIAHQLAPLDTLLLLACVVEIGEKIEAKRQPHKLERAFSYRFAVDTHSGQLFRADRTYKDWLRRQQEIIANNEDIKNVVITDISDYYSRINFHRLENLLDEVAPSDGAARFIKKHIKVIRSKQSFGLPVGGSASRILAELALADTDQALLDRDLLATRFVDDFRVFLKGSQDPYDALGYLAEHLGINEGLSLNGPKTFVSSRSEYISRLEYLTSDITEEAEGIALDTLTAGLYFDDEPDQEALEQLKSLNLIEMLGKEIAAENWEIGHIKVLFRALKITKPIEAIDFIKTKFNDLVVFAKETCLLMEALEGEEWNCFDDLLDTILVAINSPPASSIQVIRTWLLEIFVRGIVNIPLNRLKEIETLPAVIDKRQLLLIRGRQKDTNYFRKQKTAVHIYSDIELSALVWGASCLPKDEYENWIDTLKGRFNKPPGNLFLKWAKSNKTKLISKLSIATIDHPD